VRVPFTVPPFAVAENCTAVLCATGAVETVKVMFVVPAGMITVAGNDEIACDPVTMAIVIGVSTAIG
jgi:hypothetical protein